MVSSNDEVERRAISWPTIEADLSQSSILRSLSYQPIPPTGLSAICALSSRISLIAESYRRGKDMAAPYCHADFLSSLQTTAHMCIRNNNAADFGVTLFRNDKAKSLKKWLRRSAHVRRQRRNTGRDRFCNYSLQEKRANAATRMLAGNKEMIYEAV
jgi:hypothetical protein